MSSHLAAVATLALAILFSPETLVLGLIIAGDRRNPRLAALGFAIGGVTGIALATGAGLWIAHVSGGEWAAADHGSWPGFAVRVVIAAVLLAIGLNRAWAALRRQPIADIAESEPPPGRLRTALGRRFPRLAQALTPGVELPPRRSFLRGVIGGLVACGMHPKVFPIALAAGHQITQISDPTERGLAIGIFALISSVPALLPVLIDVIKPGAAGRVKDGYERVMKVNGRWVTAGLLLAAAAFVAHNAWEKLPTR